MIGVPNKCPFYTLRFVSINESHWGPCRGCKVAIPGQVADVRSKNTPFKSSLQLTEYIRHACITGTCLFLQICTHSPVPTSTAIHWFYWKDSDVTPPAQVHPMFPTSHRQEAMPAITLDAGGCEGCWGLEGEVYWYRTQPWDCTPMAPNDPTTTGSVGYVSTDSHYISSL